MFCDCEKDNTTFLTNMSSGISPDLDKPALLQSDMGLPCHLAKSLDTSECMNEELKARMILFAHVWRAPSSISAH